MGEPNGNKALRDDIISDNEYTPLNTELHKSTNDDPVKFERTNEISGRFWFKYITVEPVILFYSFAFTLTSPVTTTLYLTHTCRSLGFNQSYCRELEESGPKDLETLVQPETNLLKMYEMLIETGLPAVLTLFIGPWSDLYGRRTFIMAPILGCLFKYVIMLAMSFYPPLPPQYLLLASIPVALSGGMVSVISMCYCYIADVTEKHRRGFRMGIVEASFYAGLLLGSTTSTFIFNAGRYLAAFTTATLLSLLAVVYCVFMVQESIHNIHEGSAIGNFFKPSLVREMFAACCKLRGPKQRTILVLVTIALATAVLTMSGEGSVQFLFVRNKFSWDIEQYMMFSSVNLVLQIIGTISAVTFFSAWLGFSDALIASVSFALKAIGATILAVSLSDWWLYVASAVGMLGAVGGPLSRAIISKSVDPQDIGKVFSMVSAVEAVTPVAAGPLYALIYDETMISFPGAFFLLSAAIFAIDFLLLGGVVFLQRRHPPGYELIPPHL